ncbi:uncharacterized protein [Oscarella lobularis]|uniref:uncharacterized protein isoform X1 n=1 Tax=Oscarella lobularis TaxID=121494 RepID=UPI0033140CF0
MGFSCLCDLAMLCTLWINSFIKNFSTSRSFLSSTLGSIRRYQSERRRRNHHHGKFIKWMNCGECNVGCPTHTFNSSCVIPTFKPYYGTDYCTSQLSATPRRRHRL